VLTLNGIPPGARVRHSGDLFRTLPAQNHAALPAAGSLRSIARPVTRTADLADAREPIATPLTCLLDLALLLAFLAAEEPVRTAAERLFADSAGPLGEWTCLAVFLALLAVVVGYLVGVVEPPLPTFNGPAGPATAGEMRQDEISLRESVQRELLAAYGAPTERQTLRLIVSGV
jgi:hypothetical protein